jgi:uncharacterized DUF497 family protein
MRSRFTWDESKAAGNFRKHGVSFVPRNRLLVVAHVERGDDQYRIISARLADRRERMWYEEEE